VRVRRRVRPRRRGGRRRRRLGLVHGGSARGLNA
jgi:hypothetical protein